MCVTFLSSHFVSVCIATFYIPVTNFRVASPISVSSQAFRYSDPINITTAQFTSLGSQFYATKAQFKSRQQLHFTSEWCGFILVWPIFSVCGFVDFTAPRPNFLVLSSPFLITMARLHIVKSQFITMVVTFHITTTLFLKSLCSFLY